MDNETMMEELEHLKRQLAMTVSLKFHLMPNVYPAFPDLPGIDIYGDQIGLGKVGGDFFDFFRINNDHVGILVADIFDGGDAAALYMVAFKLYMMGELAMGFTPAELMEVVNNRLAAANEDDLCLSAWYGVYELSTGIITAVNAGHEPPVLLTKESCGECENEVQSYLLAVMENISYESYEFRLNPGDKLILYTDGMTKAGFTREMLIETLEGCRGENAEDTVGTIQEAMFDQVGEDLPDDATFVCLMAPEAVEGEGGVS